MSDWYVDECMVSIINISIGAKKLTHEYQNCNTRQKIKSKYKPIN